VAMLTLDKRWLAAAGVDPDRDIAGTIGLAGPYDFLPLHDPELEDIFAPSGDLRLSQPITFARGNAPPMLLVTGMADQTVLPRNTEHLAIAIRHDGGQVEERIYPGVNHTKIIGALAGVLSWLAPSLADVTGFLDQHTGGTKTQVRSLSWPVGRAWERLVSRSSVIGGSGVDDPEPGSAMTDAAPATAAGEAASP
jgi:hypothetical protein